MCAQSWTHTCMHVHTHNWVCTPPPPPTHTPTCTPHPQAHLSDRSVVLYRHRVIVVVCWTEKWSFIVIRLIHINVMSQQSIELIIIFPDLVQNLRTWVKDHLLCIEVWERELRTICYVQKYENEGGKQKKQMFHFSVFKKRKKNTPITTTKPTSIQHHFIHPTRCNCISWWTAHEAKLWHELSWNKTLRQAALAVWLINLLVCSFSTAECVPPDSGSTTWSQ